MDRPFGVTRGLSARPLWIVNDRHSSAVRYRTERLRCDCGVRRMARQECSLFRRTRNAGGFRNRFTPKRFFVNADLNSDTDAAPHRPEQDRGRQHELRTVNLQQLVNHRSRIYSRSLTTVVVRVIVWFERYTAGARSCRANRSFATRSMLEGPASHEPRLSQRIVAARNIECKSTRVQWTRFPHTLFATTRAWLI
jgi:hypothetical protein